VYLCLSPEPSSSGRATVLPWHTPVCLTKSQLPSFNIQCNSEMTDDRQGMTGRQ